MEIALLIKDNIVVDITHTDPAIAWLEIQLPEDTRPNMLTEVQQFTLVQPEPPSYVLDLLGMGFVLAVLGFALHKRTLRKELDEQYKRFSNPRYTEQQR